MQKLRPRSAGITLLFVVVSTSFGNLFPQGTRPIDGELGIDADGKIKGLLRSDPESVSGVRVSIAIAIGSYSSDSAEDAAISQGINGSKNFKVVSLPDAVNTIDLSAPWAPGVVLPTTDRATLVVRSVSLATNTTVISRNRLVEGMFTQIQSKKAPTPPDGQVIIAPGFSSPPPPPEPLTRTLPIDALVGMDSGGRLVGTARSLEPGAKLSVGFSPGKGQTLAAAVRRIEAKVDGYVPFTEVETLVDLGKLSRKLTTPDGVLEMAGGTIVVMESMGGTPPQYSFVNVLANNAKHKVPVNKPITLVGSTRWTNPNSGGSTNNPLTRTLPIDGAASIAEVLSPGNLTGTVTYIPALGDGSNVGTKSSTYWVGFAPNIDSDVDKAVGAINRSRSWVQLSAGVPFNLEGLRSKVCRVGVLVLREIESESGKRDKLYYASTNLNEYQSKKANKSSNKEE